MDTTQKRIAELKALAASAQAHSEELYATHLEYTAEIAELENDAEGAAKFRAWAGDYRRFATMAYAAATLWQRMAMEAPQELTVDERMVYTILGARDL